MRKRILFITLVFVGLMSTSCTHYIYDVHTLRANYDARMTSQEDLEIKSKVKIFTSENDIKGDYELLSFNYYAPFRLFPFAKPWVKRTSKSFYKKAVQIAYEEGGNAIIIVAPLNYKVIRLTNFDEEAAIVEQYKSAVFDVQNMNIVKSGALTTMSRGDRRKTLNSFEGEIESNVANIQYLPEVAMAREKIDAYKQYNESQKHAKSSIEKFIKKQTKKLNSREKKIKKLIAKNKIDSVFMDHSAICEKQWECYKKGEVMTPAIAIPQPKAETPQKEVTQPKVETTKEVAQPKETPQKQEVETSQKKETATQEAPASASPIVEEEQEPTVTVSTQKAIENVNKQAVLKAVEDMNFTYELYKSAINGTYVMAFDFNADGQIDQKELRLVKNLSEESDLNGDHIWDESGQESLRHRFKQVVKYYK